MITNGRIRHLKEGTMRQQTIKDLGITDKLASQAIAKYADLQIQAIMFDMDIDIETWTLIPKETYREPFWLTGWKEKIEQSDNRPEDEEQNWGEI